MTVPTGPGAYGEASGYAADPAYGYTAPYVTAAHVDTLSYVDPSQYTVTVVVAAYNASATLDRALRSALNQTHRGVEVLVVDDASTDGTLEVAHQYARQDSRVRVVPRPYNSGGVGAPRNNGIESATGQYLLFLDADDELPHKACEVLLASALATGAEITAGRALRINLAKDETTVWQPQLYATDRTVSGGLAAAPELFDDPIAAAKLFRVDFLHHHGIRFPRASSSRTPTSPRSPASARGTSPCSPPPSTGGCGSGNPTRRRSPTAAPSCAASATGCSCTSGPTSSSPGTVGRT
ncbi:glycosyltransferase family 2 protein [Streptomyces sp. SHP22-7]|nr:glycosyltransferase family 2 protein [Streptomyces sp. SHP22-7]